MNFHTDMYLAHPTDHSQLEKLKDSVTRNWEILVKMVRLLTAASCRGDTWFSRDCGMSWKSQCVSYVRHAPVTVLTERQSATLLQSELETEVSSWSLVADILKLLAETELTGQTAFLGMDEQWNTESIPTRFLTGEMTVSEKWQSHWHTQIIGLQVPLFGVHLVQGNDG